MARERSISPEFFVDEELATVSHSARLLFIALWTMADREGRLENRPRKIRLGAFPYEDVAVEPLLDELAEKGFIVRYEGDGQPLIQVRTFTAWQHVHPREAPSRLPPPAKGEPGSALGEPRSAKGGTGSALGEPSPALGVPPEDHSCPALGKPSPALGKPVRSDLQAFGSSGPSASSPRTASARPDSDAAQDAGGDGVPLSGTAEQTPAPLALAAPATAGVGSPPGQAARARPRANGKASAPSQREVTEAREHQLWLEWANALEAAGFPEPALWAPTDRVDVRSLLAKMQRYQDAEPPVRAAELLRRVGIARQHVTSGSAFWRNQTTLTLRLFVRNFDELNQPPAHRTGWAPPADFSHVPPSADDGEFATSVPRKPEDA